MRLSSFRIPTQEAIDAWVAAASTAGALMPAAVAAALKPTYEGQPCEWDNYPRLDPQLQDATGIVMAVIEAAKAVYFDPEADGWEGCPVPRGMQVGIEPDGTVSLVWVSETHTITLLFGSGGWGTGAKLGFSRLVITGENLENSPRVRAAVAASPTLQEKGW